MLTTYRLAVTATGEYTTYFGGTANAMAAIVTTFNRVNQLSEEGGIQDAEYLAKYHAERVRTTAGAFLGSTMGCAECHDHKFDPFSMEDFYRLSAFFADIKEKGVFENDSDVYPEMALTSRDPAEARNQSSAYRRLEREILTPDLSPVEHIIGRKVASLSFSVEMKSNGSFSRMQPWLHGVPRRSSRLVPWI